MEAPFDGLLTKIKEVLSENLQVVIQSDFHMPQGNEWIYGKVLKYTLYTAFLFMGQAFWKENIEDRVKLLE